MSLFKKKKFKNYELPASMVEYERKQNAIFDLPDNQNAPIIINTFRKEYRGRKLSELSEAYFEFSEIIKETYIDDINKHLKYCILASGPTEPVIQFDKLNSGLNYCQIKRFHAFDFAPKYFALQGARGQLANFKDIIIFFEELKEYLEVIDKAYCILELRPKIFELIKTNNGITNKEFEDAFPDESEFINDSFMYLWEKMGVVKSNKKRGRYKLYELT